MKQTAVEWLIKELRGTDDKGDFIFQGVITSELLEQAKAMEKQQIVDAAETQTEKSEITGLDYYNQTYKPWKKEN